MNPRNYLKDLFLEALETLSPENIVSDTVRRADRNILIGDREINPDEQPVYLLAVGKAAVPMAKGMIKAIGADLAGLLVICPDGTDVPDELRRYTIYGTHPEPDELSLEAGKRAAGFFEQVPARGVVVTLISGGTSSLMCLPSEGISIGDLNQTFRLLNNSGATIREINAVRKHCSQIKGGQLLSFLDPSVTLIDLVISDVPDDDLSVIGSGPTTVDDSHFRDAHQVLVEYDLWDQLPAAVRKHVGQGLEGEITGTVQKGRDLLKQHDAHILSSARKLAGIIAQRAEHDSYHVQLQEGAYNRDVKEVAAMVSEKAKKVADGEGEEEVSLPAMLVFYGESTVNVTGGGKGGRNQELALRAAVEIDGYDGITLLSAGSDGIDGPTDAAGAIVDGQTISRAKDHGLDPGTYLRDNDSYYFHLKADTLLKTGPTGNNLMDVVLVLVQ